MAEEQKQKRREYMREYSREYYHKHREERLAKQKKYRNEREQKEKRLERQRRYYHKHREDILRRNKEYYKQYREEHKEQIKQYHDEHKEQNKQYREKHKEQIKRYAKQYRDEHKEQNKQYREEHKEQIKRCAKQYRNTKNGRARSLANAYRFNDNKDNLGKCTITPEWIIDNIFSGQVCHWCGETDWRKLGCDRIDNYKPHTPDNVNPCCWDCNRKRKSVSYKFFKMMHTPVTVKIWK